MPLNWLNHFPLHLRLFQDKLSLCFRFCRSLSLLSIHSRLHQIYLCSVQLLSKQLRLPQHMFFQKFVCRIFDCYGNLLCIKNIITYFLLNGNRCIVTPSAAFDLSTLICTLSLPYDVPLVLSNTSAFESDVIS